MGDVGNEARDRADHGRIGVVATLGVYCMSSAVAAVVLALAVLKVIDMLNLLG